MPTVPLEAIVLLPPEVNTRLKVFAFVGFEDLQAAHPQLELFVAVWKVDPANPYAVVFGLPKAVIAERGWPVWVDPEKRWVMVRPIPAEELAARDNR